ncbi:MAG TPA: tripartite tricarboxylate transporter substrate binding protein [Burkholderiales bacterium]|nr:tripartite tricarboxylate transporter substrate binding protein [Burkholderiales bacterium]
MNATLNRPLSALSFIAFALGVGGAGAQNYPSRPVRVIVPFAPGGSTDIVARMLAPRLSENLGQQVVVDNRGGGATTIGMDMVAKSAPDGYMLGVATLTFALNPSLFSKLPYNTEKDFAPVSLVSIVPFVMAIHPSVPSRSVKQLIALAKAKPGSLNYSSSGNGSASQMATELFKYMTGTDMVHVPYTGGGPALLAVLSGQVSIFFTSIPAGLPHFKTGKLVGLGITSSSRDPTLPDVPTIAESGLPGYELLEYQGIVAPAGTPGAVISRLHQEIVKALASPDLKERFTSSGTYVVGSTPEEFAIHLKKQLTTWAKVIKAAGIRLD